MFKLLSIFILLVQAVAWFPLTTVIQAEDALPAQLLISEIKVRYDTNLGTDNDEFIELFNNTAEPILLNDYVLEYYNSAIPTESQQPVQKPIAAKVLAPYAYVTLAKQPNQIEFSVVSPFSSLADTGGRMRLVTVEGEVIDEISWTNTQSLALATSVPPILFQCNTSTVLCSANRTQSLSRIVEVSPDGTRSSKWALGTTNPQSDQLLEPESREVVLEEPPIIVEVPEIVTPVSTCEGLVISELLPNPDGADTGKEFIELHNPTTNPIALEGCGLQTSANNRTFMFSEVVLGPGGYLAFYDTVTSLILTNAAGGTVWLLSPTEEINTVTYPANIDDDSVWANVAGVWVVSYASTPDNANVALAMKPCTQGQIRSASTGQCEDPVSVKLTNLSPCKPGQERSLDTNRCRTAYVSSVAGLTPCKLGQERNSETNRCRAVLAATTLAPCDEDEARNPDTNRCRKISTAGAASLPDVQDVVTERSASSPAWWLIGLVTFGAIGYGLYEWRSDVREKLGKVLAKFNIT